MAADNHVPQFSERGREDDFGQIITEMDILLFLRRGRKHRSTPAYATGNAHNKRMLPQTIIYTFKMCEEGGVKAQPK